MKTRTIKASQAQYSSVWMTINADGTWTIGDDEYSGIWKSMNGVLLFQVHQRTDDLRWEIWCLTPSRAAAHGARA
jgi:hypothetical protein